MEFTGSYGIVLKTDKETAEKAVALADKILPKNSDYKVTVETAHITLYHLQLFGLKFEKMLEILSATREKIIERNFILGQIAVMGGKFLFWDVENREKLLSAHKSALALAKFLNREAIAKAKTECLKLSSEQLESLEKYGHPLSGEKLYRPHITLGYDKEGIEGISGRVEKHEAIIEKVIFGKIGDYGRLEKVVAEL